LNSAFHPGNPSFSPTISRRLPKTHNAQLFFIAILICQSHKTMKTLLAAHLFHFALKAAEHLHAIIHSIGHLVK
jgi:hypothetical protein